MKSAAMRRRAQASVLGMGVLVAGVLLLAGCGLIRRDDVELPHTSAFEECEEYAVIDDVHLFLYAEPSRDARVVRLSRRGDLFAIVDRNTNQDSYYNQQASWYLIHGAGARGWVFGAGMTPYCYKYQAELQQKISAHTNETRAKK